GGAAAERGNRTGERRRQSGSAGAGTIARRRRGSDPRGGGMGDRTDPPAGGQVRIAGKISPRLNPSVGDGQQPVWNAKHADRWDGMITSTVGRPRCRMPPLSSAYPAQSRSSGRPTGGKVSPVSVDSHSCRAKIN